MSAKDATHRGFDPIGYLHRHPGLRKTLIWCLAATIAFGAILTALPIAVARYAEGWLRDNGAAGARIEDVDINPFTGVVRVFGLQASGGERERLDIGYAELGIHWWPLASQRIHVESLQLADAQVDLVAAEAGAWSVGAVKIQPAEHAAAGEPAELELSTEDAPVWGFGSDIVALTNVQLTYRDTLFDTSVDVRELLVGSHFTWDAGRSTELTVDVSIDGAPIVLKSDVLPWAEQRQLSGALTLNDLNLADYGQVLQELAGLEDPRGTINFDLQMNAMYDADGTLELQISGPLEVRNASIAFDDMAIANEILRWRGEVGIKLPAPDEGSLLRVQGDLQLTGARAMLGDLELAAELATLGWNGAMEFSPARSADVSADLLMQSALTGTGFKLDHARMPFPVAALETIDANNFEISGMQNATVQQLRLQGLRLLGRPQGAAQVADVLSLELLEINGFGFDAQRTLTADTLVLRGAKATLVRNEQGEFERIAAAIAAFTDAAEADDGKALDGEPAEQVEPPASLRIMVADLQVQADALLRFEDRAVTPAATFKLTNTDISIKNLDSSNDKPMDVHLVTGDGNMTFTADGTASVFTDNLSAELDTRLAALELAQISTYLRDYNIERGRLTADSHLVINDDTVDMHNALLIEKLKLSAKSAEGNAAPAQGMGMPVDVALDLLRDGDDRIEMELPVSGSLADPQFGTGNIMRQAIQKALQNAAMTYVKNALQPLGTILLIRNIAAKSARPRFVPVEMAPGDASLSSTGREYLQKLGALLSERPGLQLTICGVATPADRKVLTSAAMDSATAEVVSAPSPAPPAAAAVSDEALLELAALRTAALIGFLVDEENIEQERLFACRETIETSDDQGPRAEISL